MKSLGTEIQEFFKKLKEQLCNDTVLYYPKKDLQLLRDAKNY